MTDLTLSLPLAKLRAANTIHVLSLVATIAVCVIYAAHALTFREWIIDDAGISFAYARNLAEGYGLTAQPGLPPVEGYSNFLWIVLLTPFFWFDGFDPAVTPKLVSIVLVWATFAALHVTLSRFPGGAIGAPLALLLIALNPSFAIWTASGLENPLYALVVSLLFAAIIRSQNIQTRPAPAGVAIGALAAAASMTRPDGLLFASLYPVLLPLLHRSGFREHTQRRRLLARLAAYLLTFGLLYGGFLVFRLLYFGDLVPNTFHAKGGPTVETLARILTLQPMTIFVLEGLLKNVAETWAPAVVLGISVLSALLIVMRRFRRAHLALGLFLAGSTAVFLLLPGDWMHETRFATPFIVFFYAYGVMIAAAFVASLPGYPALRWGAFFLAAALLVSALYPAFAARSTRYAGAPDVPFAGIARNFALPFNEYARRLGIENGSLLTPDLGGALYYSALTVYDLAGLTDKTIARTLNKDTAALHEYVFEEIRPTFINIRGVWAYYAAFDTDARFRRDYVPICEAVQEAVKRNWGKTVYGGRYVRKDAIRDTNQTALAELQRSCP